MLVVFVLLFCLSCTTLSSDCRAGASAAAAAARHAGCVCSFFFPHNADVSSTDFFSRIWAEPANITHLEWCLKELACCFHPCPHGWAIPQGARLPCPPVRKLTRRPALDDANVIARGDRHPPVRKLPVESPRLRGTLRKPSCTARPGDRPLRGCTACTENASAGKAPTFTNNRPNGRARSPDSQCSGGRST